MTEPMDLSQYRAQRPDRIGQGTAIEQSRAAAEVYASVLAAQQMPRSESRAVDRVKTACGRPEMSKRAFFSFRRGDGLVAGPTIALAKEAARCWGNIHYGLSELRRDDEYRQSEMQAWAWDLESNQRVATTFIVPHARWAKGAAQPLVDFRDVYENNANNGARRLREMIFSVLPDWYMDEAKAAAMNSLSGPESVPIAVKAANIIKAYGVNGVTRDQLEQQRDAVVDRWTVYDIAQLDILYGSLQRGEISKADAFPPRRISDEDIAAQAKGGMPHAAVPAVPSPEGTAGDDGTVAWSEVAQPGGSS